jgi:selenocysteine lyase/cysteine desulfurase
MHWKGWLAHLEEARRKAAALINARPEEVALVHNTVEGISIVAGGLAWREGDNVVTAYGEYPANVYPWLNLAPLGVETRMVPDRAGRIILDDLFAAVDERTRVIALSFVEFGNGFRNDLAAVGGFCRRRGIRFVVDAIQGLGVLPLNVQAMQIDFLAAGSYKWLLGPQGTAIFYCRQDLIEGLRLIQAGPDSAVRRAEYVPYDFTLWPDARRFEPGAQNNVGVYGLAAALDLLAEAGIENVERHVMGLLDVVVEGLRGKGCEILSSLEPRERSGILSFRSPKVATPELLARLLKARVAVTARLGGIRVAPHLYNSREDVARLLGEIP